MPCMKLTSASTGVFAGVTAAAGVSFLLLLPGAPGCTIGARAAAGLVCWANAAADPRESTVAQIVRTEKAMRQYTSWGFTGSTRLPPLACLPRRLRGKQFLPAGSPGRGQTQQSNE